MIRRSAAFWSAFALLATALIAGTPISGASAVESISFSDWNSISAGDNHTCGTRSDGKLYCWGNNEEGEVGDGSPSGPVYAPLRIGSFADWAQASAGGNHTCGVRKNGKLYCWGYDNFGQIGDGASTGATSPRRIGSFEDWANVSASYRHTCGVRKNGKLYCWGRDTFGQIGDGDVANDHAAPSRIGTFEDWVRVDAGGHHTCGVRANGKLYCWGHDYNGQVGDGADTGATSPRRIGTFEDWSRVAAGLSHTCGVRTNGKLYCWGYGEFGQVGDSEEDLLAESPRRIGSFEDWSRIAAGDSHTCGARTNGKLYCWGSDSYGQIGDDDGTHAIAPRRVSSSEDWATVTAGENHSCGIRAHKLYCWGRDNLGQLGDGTDDDTPVTVPRRI
jgi:alpha-tubulin suppressor-like RCC1 family protein